jgi:hypothetical protein
LPSEREHFVLKRHGHMTLTPIWWSAKVTC